MENTSQKMSSPSNGKVYTNAGDRTYHKHTDCRWMLPTKYEEVEMGQISQQGKKPCKNCAA